MISHIFTKIRIRCSMTRTNEQSDGTIDFFIKCKRLHSYFERNAGSFEKAMVNADRSMEEKLSSGRNYTFSELARLMGEHKKLE